MQIFVSLKDGKSIKICHAKLIRMRLIFAVDATAHYSIQHDSTILEIFGWRVGGGSVEEFKQAEAKAEDCPICLEKIVVDDVVLPCHPPFSSKHRFHRYCIGKYIKEKCLLDLLCQ